MKYPKFISEKSIIGVPAPSDGADSEVKINRYKNAYERFKNLGYEVVLSNNLYKSDKGRSSSAKIRAKEINDMFKSNLNFILVLSNDNVSLIITSVQCPFPVNDKEPYNSTSYLSSSPNSSKNNLHALSHAKVCELLGPAPILYISFIACILPRHIYNE